MSHCRFFKMKTNFLPKRISLVIFSSKLSFVTSQYYGMYKYYLVPFLFVILAGIQNLAAREVQDNVQTPLTHFSIQQGTDRMLIDYESLILYMRQLTLRSTRVKITKTGESPMGKKMYLLFFSPE